MCAKSLQLCPTLCNPMDYSPPGPSVHGILQARILEWVAISSSRGSSRPWNPTHVSCVSSTDRQIFTTEPPRKSQYASRTTQTIFSWQKKNIHFCIHATDVYWEPAVCISADRALNDVTKTVTSRSLDSSGETPNGGSTSIFSENTFLWWWCPFSKNWLSLLWKNNSHHQLSKYLSLAYLRMPLHTSQ